MITLGVFVLLFFLFVFVFYLILSMYERSRGYPKKNENIDNVISLYEQRENILALRCYRRISGASLRDAKKFLNKMEIKK